MVISTQALNGRPSGPMLGGAGLTDTSPVRRIKVPPRPGHELETC